MVGFRPIYEKNCFFLRLYGAVKRFFWIFWWVLVVFGAVKDIL
jgi:hypothetical protein